MKGLSLFSGIGGLDLAAGWAGIETIGFCEIEPFPVEILRRRWPNVPIVDDVRTVHGDGWEAVDIVFGGFPCQDLSVAGKQKGLEGARSGLWFEMLRVIREIRPRWLLAENVRGAINLALDTVQSSLECEGYKVWPLVIPASAVGAPHQRERLVVVGAREDVADVLAERLQGGEWGCTFLEQGSTPSEPAFQCSQGGELWPTLSVCGNHNQKGASSKSGDGLATAVKKLWRTLDANCARGASSPERYQWKLENGMPISINDQVGHEGGEVGGLNPDWCECFMGLPIGWTDLSCDTPVSSPGWPMLMGIEQYEWEPPRTVKGMPHRSKRLKALGNAVVPQQAYPLFRAIAEMERMTRESEVA